MNQLHDAINLNHALSVRSDFSIGQSLLKVEQIIDEAVRHGYESVALVDDMTVSNMVDFTCRAREAGIKPLIGCRLRVVDDSLVRQPAKASREGIEFNLPVMVKVYVMNETGMIAVMKLLTKANRPDHSQSRVGWEDVMALEGVVVTTGDIDNLFQHADHAVLLERLLARFGNTHLFAELVPIDTPLFDMLNAKALAAAARWGIPTLASYPFLVRQDEEGRSLAVMQAIVRRAALATIPATTSPFGFQPPWVLAERIAQAAARVAQCQGVAEATQWAESTRNMATLVQLCQYEFKRQPISLPVMAPNEFALLGQKCIAGWQRRAGNPVLGHAPSQAQYGLYRERMLCELAVLKERGLVGYFLVLEDLATWARHNDILLGPGRGSAGGSLVAFLIGITEIDPIRFNLQFERFIHPGRQDLPDLDLDVMSTRRLRVIDYLTRRHGADRVAGISHFTTLVPAVALRETGRLHDLDAHTMATIRHLPKVQGQAMRLREVVKVMPKIARLQRCHPAIWQHALRLEGVMRTWGTHPVGIVVAGEPLTHRAVLEMRAAKGGAKVINWDKRAAAQWGLIKMDILGLTTLDMLDRARKLVEQRHGVVVDYLSMPLDDAKVMAGFAKGDTAGVFQFESAGMQQLLCDLAKGGPLTFDDIAAAAALYRPGPIKAGLMRDFVQIRQGVKAVHYDHPKMVNALASTHSVIVYQEQVVQLAIDLAGFSSEEADCLRRAMSNKDPQAMAAMRAPWRTGCVATSTMDAAMADALFEKIAAFASFGLNRAHAISYSVISVWTMWLRVRYPDEFIAARWGGDDARPSALSPERHGKKVPGVKSARTPRRIDNRTYCLEAVTTPGNRLSATVVERLEPAGAPGALVPVRQARQLPHGERAALDRKILHIVQDYRACRGCNLSHRGHPAVRTTSIARFMVVTDSPAWQEAKLGQLQTGLVGDVIRTALQRAALSPDDGYFTTLVKGEKSDKVLSASQIESCAPFLKRELALVRPPIIVALGKAAIRRFVPGFKGSSAGMDGRTWYDAELDATIVCGANPQQMYYTPSTMAALVTTFTKVAQLLAQGAASS